MDKKPISLVPYKSYLAPPNATHKKIHPIIPNRLGYQGKVLIALTSAALWVVTPSADYEQIPFMNISDVKVENFPGIFYLDEVDGVSAIIAPNDTAGVTVEYNIIGRGPARISFLTHLPNIAYQWVRLITDAKITYYKQKFLALDPLDGEE